MRSTIYPGVGLAVVLAVGCSGGSTSTCDSRSVGGTYTGTVQGVACGIPDGTVTVEQTGSEIVIAVPNDSGTARSSRLALDPAVSCAATTEGTITLVDADGNTVTADISANVTSGGLGVAIRGPVSCDLTLSR